MKTSRNIGIPACCFLMLALVGMARADVPKKPPISRYTSLWSNSPFTTKPIAPIDGPVNNPLDDYALLGVSSIGDKGETRVTLIHKKTPDVRITVDSGAGREGFKILNVTRKSGNPLGTVVEMMSGTQKGTVAFDEKLLTIAAPKVAPQVPAGAPPQMGNPQTPQAAGTPQTGAPPNNRTVRPRVIPPPTPQPGVQQPAPQQNQRASRRGN